MTLSRARMCTYSRMRRLRAQHDDPSKFGLSLLLRALSGTNYLTVRSRLVQDDWTFFTVYRRSNGSSYEFEDPFGSEGADLNQA